jgi:tripartite-type tricarboxylate transporter receptor subunit TctC
VPFDGVAPVFTALLAGDVQLLFSTAAAARPFVESGKVRTIAGGGIKRDPLAPNLPTVAESGAPGFEVRPAWFGMMAPAGMPRDLVDQLNRAFAAVLQDEEVAKRFKDLGMNIAGGSPEDLAEVLKQDVAAFEKAAKLANISPQ